MLLCGCAVLATFVLQFKQIFAWVKPFLQLAYRFSDKQPRYVLNRLPLNICVVKELSFLAPHFGSQPLEKYPQLQIGNNVNRLRQSTATQIVSPELKEKHFHRKYARGRLLPNDKTSSSSNQPPQKRNYLSRPTKKMNPEMNKKKV